MARFVPRMLRNRRTDLGSEELEDSQREHAGGDDATESQSAAATGTAGQDHRRPRPRKAQDAETTDDSGKRDRVAADTSSADETEDTDTELDDPDSVEERDDHEDVEQVEDSPEPDGSTSAAARGEDADQDDGAAPTRRRTRTKASRSRTAETTRPRRAAADSPARSRPGRKEGRAERGKAGRKVVSAPRAGSNRRERAAEAAISRLRRTALNLAVWTAVVALLLASAWYWKSQVEQLDNARRDATASAISAAESIFSYDYRAFDESVSNGSDFVTGKFKTEYAKTTAGLEKSVKKEKAIVRARVSEASVTEASVERVEVLLFVNQFRRNVNISGEKVDENRVLLTMVKADDGSWLVSDAAAI